ncbi:hypothetical protein CA13_11200 [Planctomycetes bacterium CA13]|uniref:3-keto-alpha-glucoside-1,2-lyase/3-keto-2-hydroxy-glucal hydratase domain-containing protein n=1 Tax=Novipirellula herctigrandis TaxID=2527986 RepID=A0A5C5YZ77_9BACT|nr:hypothetical protein CA13_11200 [Planctomycetes bacterium CA13]
MTRIVFTILLFAISGRPAMCDGWSRLFNGTDLTGWKANNTSDSFSVVDGLLRVQATGRTAAHLFFTGDRKTGIEPIKNFELKAVARSEPESNGGIFFHTDMKVRNAKKHLANGYEVQLNSSKTENRKTGSLYAVVDLATSPIDETQWFSIRILVNGDHVAVFINDEQVINYTEPPNPKRPPNRAGRVLKKTGGAIALQAHDRNSVWYFKDIQMKRLP